MALESDPMPGRTVRVTVPYTALGNLKQMHAITEKVLARLGCPACHSGFDIRFRHEEDLRVKIDAAGIPEVIGSGQM